MADQDLIIKVTVDDKGAVRSFQQLDSELSKVKGSAKEASGAVEDFVKSALTIGAVVGAYKGFAETLKRGSDVNDAADAFENLSKQAGTSANTFLTSLNSATHNTITNFELMKTANLAFTASLKPDQILIAAKAAQVFSDSFGGSAKENLDALVESLAKGDDRFLKSRGILIDNTKAYKDFAVSLGQSADAYKNLNEQGKAAAIRAAEIQALKDKFGGLQGSAIDAGDAVTHVETALKNLVDHYASKIAQNPSVVSFWDDVGKGIDRLIPIIDTAISKIGQLAATVEKKLPTEQGLIERAKNIAISSAGAGLAGLGTFIGNSQGGNANGFKVMADIFKALSANIGGVTKEVNILSKTAVPPLISAFKATTGATKETGSMFNALDEAVKKANSLEGIKGFTQNIVDLAEAERQGLISKEEYAKRLLLIINLMNEGKLSADQIARSLNVAGGIIDETRAKLEKGFGSGIFGQSVLGSIFPKAGGSDPAGTTNIINGIISTIQTIPKLIGGNTEDIVGSIGLILGGPIGEALATTVLQVIRIFTKDSAATIARKGVDKFFADIFDKNRITALINGQLTTISDLTFGKGSFGSASGGFFSILDSIPDKARGAFNAVGDAFALLTGVFDQLGHNIGAVFANNLGGSVENLQVLIQATGKSFEDLSQQIVDAFLNGKLSFVEAQTDLIQLQEVMQVGIPGAVGATVQAFQSILDAGTTGGRYSVNALRNLGAEAEDLNIKTIDGLIKNLEASGKISTATAEQFRTEVEKLGITTTEQLKTLTDTQALTVLSNLQTVGFAFKEAAAATGDIVDKVNAIPSKVVKDLVFRVDMQYSPAASTPLAQNVLNKANVRLPVGVQ